MIQNKFFPYRSVLATLSLAVVFSSCGEESVSVAPGNLEYTLLSPNSAEGAAYLRLEGPGLGILAVTSGRIITETSADTVHVLIVLDTPGEIRFNVEISDSNLRPVVRIVEVAGPDNQLRDPSGYSVFVTP